MEAAAVIGRIDVDPSHSYAAPTSVDSWLVASREVHAGGGEGRFG